MLGRRTLRIISLKGSTFVGRCLLNILLVILLTHTFVWLDILEGTEEHNKADLERLVYAHGGDYRQGIPKENPRIISVRTDCEFSLCRSFSLQFSLKSFANCYSPSSQERASTYFLLIVWT
jgi:hypothetical protein